ncbi:MAG: hypothetical protein QW343_03715 [Candidatus Norongarragalinales archaeon]
MSLQVLLRQLSKKIPKKQVARVHYVLDFVPGENERQVTAIILQSKQKLQPATKRKLMEFAKTYTNKTGHAVVFDPRHNAMIIGVLHAVENVNKILRRFNFKPTEKILDSSIRSTTRRDSNTSRQYLESLKLLLR